MTFDEWTKSNPLWEKFYDADEKEIAREVWEVADKAVRAVLLDREGWQPIETAPKDSTTIDIWRSGFGGERCTDMRRVDLGDGNVFYEATISGPACCRDATHWMPTPDAPKGRGEPS